jgi:hypothetical protein
MKGADRQIGFSRAKALASCRRGADYSPARESLSEFPLQAVIMLAQFCELGVYPRVELGVSASIRRLLLLQRFTLALKVCYFPLQAGVLCSDRFNLRHVDILSGYCARDRG